MAYPLLTFFLVLLTTPLCIKLAKRYDLYDLPDAQRKMHTWKVPYTGGLSIIFAFTATFAAIWIFEGVGYFTKTFPHFIPLYLYTVEATFIIVVLGVYDDLKELTYFQKFFFQFIAAFLMVLGAIKSNLFPQVFSIADTSVLMNSFGMIISVLWLVGTTNAINMIDGMDGLAAGTSVISATALAILAFIWGHAIISVLLLCLAGALLAFLIFNFHPARVFMGDGGSMFVGFILAVCGWILVGSTPRSTISVVIPIIILGLPVSDTLLAFFRRIVKGKNPFSADLLHIHHLLQSRFRFSLRRSVFLLYMIAALYGCVGLIVAVIPQSSGWIVIGALACAQLVSLHFLGYTTLITGREPSFFEYRVEPNLPEGIQPYKNGQNGNGKPKERAAKNIDFLTHRKKK